MSFKKIEKPLARRVKAAEADPKPLTPVKGIGQNSPIAGVLYLKSDGHYELIDGYGRAASLEQDGGAVMGLT